MKCIFLDSIGPETKQLLLSQKPDDMVVEFWDEIAAEDKAVKLAEARALITATYIVNGELLCRAPNVKIVQRLGVGTDNIDSAAAQKYGVAVGNVPGGNANGVAELTIGLILDLYRKISVLNQETKACDWSMWKYRTCSYEMKGKVHGIIGFGNIGKRLAELSKAFGTTLLYYSRTRASAEVEKQYAITYMELDELLKHSDIVSVHLPLNDATRNLINAEKLALMKPNAILINVGRGNVINEPDLHQALIQGKLAGAAVDVWATEPVTKENPLLSLDNVIATPHVGGGTVDAALNIYKCSFQKIHETLTACK
jgi:phosphoglycerate dehydrogenase-like enzyme